MPNANLKRNLSCNSVVKTTMLHEGADQVVNESHAILCFANTKIQKQELFWTHINNTPLRHVKYT